VIVLVVLGPKWLQPKTRTRKALRDEKVIWDERLSHAARLFLGSHRQGTKTIDSPAGNDLGLG
jgi:hypothetical protein